MSEFQDINLWQNLNGKIKANDEFGLPLSSSTSAPTVGIGAQRANPTTGAPEYWDGGAWQPVGNTNWTPGNSFAS
jgi:hypothetical protein